MPRAYYLLALIALPPVSGCMTKTYSSDPPPSTRYPVPPTPCDAPPPLTSGPPTPSVWPAAPLTATPVTSPLGVPVPPGLTVPPAAASLTVANVHKEPVSIFRVRDGRLEFVAQVPPGEAVDIPVGAGAALAATFTQAPHCVNYAAKGREGEVWLLRPAPAAPTCLAVPATPVPCLPVAGSPAVDPLLVAR